MEHDPVQMLIGRADAASIPMAAICDRAKVAQSTPSRWRTDKNGPTFSTLRKLNAALDALIAEKAAANVVHAADPMATRPAASTGKSGDFAAAQQGEAA